MQKEAVKKVLCQDPSHAAGSVVSETHMVTFPKMLTVPWRGQTSRK